MKKAVILFLCCAVSFAGGYCFGESSIFNVPMGDEKKGMSNVALAVAEQATTQLATKLKSDVKKNKAEKKTVDEKRKALDPSWFDDAVFLGDSITVFLSYYCDAHPEALGDAQFFSSGSLSYGNAQWEMNDPEAVHPSYKGEVHFAEDCVQVTGAKKVFVLMGINDIAVYGLDGAVENADSFLDKLKAKADGAVIYVQSTTPIIKGMENENISNEKVRAFNVRLAQLAQEKELAYLDVYSAVCDEDGYLRYEYCCDPEDMGIHFSWDGCQAWSNYLKENVGEQS